MFKGICLTAIAEQLGVQDQQLPAAQIQRIVTDSRAVQAGDLFVAIKGERFDAHQFLSAVAAQGAVAAIVTERQPELTLPQILVADARQALAEIALLNRQQFKGLAVAVTGSSGKTTVKELLASILRCQFGEAAVLATRGNLNNELGVPFTLFELAEQHQAAVIELGASHLGEIAYTVKLAEPQVVIINNAGSAHIGEFGGVENIVRAKGEIIDSCASVKQVVLNLDDPAFAVWQARADQRPVTSFSLRDPAADFYAAHIQLNQQGHTCFELCVNKQSYPIQLQLLGQHNVANALAAAAAASLLGVAMPAIVQGLAALAPVTGRMQTHKVGSLTLIDDSYNANPASMCAAIDLLSEMPGKRVLVLGDMGELGEWVGEAHAQVGEYANHKVDALYVVGEQMAAAVAAHQGPAYHFADQAALIAALQPQLTERSTILIKGSRSAAMDQVVQACLANVQENP